MTSIFPLLAFGFGSPWLLWGLALASIPVIIHLLHKRRYRETEWAAMRFLLEAVRKNARRTRLEQLILLAVRALLLLLLAAALAEPFVESHASLFETARPTHRIVVVDASFSMGHVAGQVSRFDRAKQMARQIVESANQGDAFNVVRICESPPFAIVRQAAYRADQVLEEIDQLKMTEEPGNLAVALEEVNELLSSADEIELKKVYFISDFQRSTWWPEAAPSRAEARRLLKQLAERADLTLVDLGKTHTANAAVVSLETDEPFVSIGQEVILDATVRNLGPVRLNQQPVELYVDNQLSAASTVDVEPGTAGRANFRVSFSDAGEHRLEARIAGDGLKLDNRRWLSLPVVDQLNILLVNGKPAGRAAGTATHFLETVLSPSTSREPWRGATRPIVISEGELPSFELGRYDCVFLCNVGMFTEAEANLLQAYVEGGGGLVILPGDQLRAENYNRVLYRDGKGVLPARLGDRVKVADNDRDGFRFDVADLTHPIVNAFAGSPGTGLESTITLEYVRAEAPANSQARVALRFSSGDPAIVEKPVGRGRTILVTTSADVGWGTWPVIRSFPPMIHEMIRFAVSGRRSQRDLLVGEPLTKKYAIRGSSPNATVSLPDGQQETVTLSESNGIAELSFKETKQSGIYTVALEGHAPELFSVNIDPRESDLTKTSETELEAELLPDTPYDYRTTLDDAMDVADTGDVPRAGLTRWLLIAVFSLLFVEQMMAWRFLYGLVLLYALVAAAFIRQAYLTTPSAAAVVALAAIAGLVAVLAVAHRTRGRRVARAYSMRR